MRSVAYGVITTNDPATRAADTRTIRARRRTEEAARTAHRRYPDRPGPPGHPGVGPRRTPFGARRRLAGPGPDRSGSPGARIGCRRLGAAGEGIARGERAHAT